MIRSDAPYKWNRVQSGRAPLGSEKDEPRYPFVPADAMHARIPRPGTVRSTTVLISKRITRESQREILGLERSLGEPKDAWREYLESLCSRGL